MNFATTKNMSAIQNVAELNRNGVFYLANGDASSALKTFKQALVQMGAVVNSGDQLPMVEQSSDAAATASVEVTGLKDTYLYIFNRAFLLSSEMCVEDLTWANACLVFNLALAFQQRGMMRGEADKLQKAHRIYEMAAKLAVAAAQQGASNHSILIMAAMNNQAHICYTVGHYEQSRAHLMRIPQFAQIDATAAFATKGAFKPEDLDEIFLNVAIMQPPSTAATA